MDVSIEFVPTSTSTLRRSEMNFCLDLVIIEDRTVIVEDTTDTTILIDDSPSSPQNISYIK